MRERKDDTYANRIAHKIFFLASYVAKLMVIFSISVILFYINNIK